MSKPAKGKPARSGIRFAAGQFEGAVEQWRDAPLEVWRERYLRLRQQTDMELIYRLAGDAPKQDPRIGHIESVLEEMGYHGAAKLSLPDGVKGEVRKQCLKDHRLFTPPAFQHAWKAGVDEGLFRMANHTTYARKK